ncbi:hypothetical protein ACJZ2D_016983 [Fusarium nematophilum]
MDTKDTSKATPKGGRVFICLASAFCGEVPRDVAQRIKDILRSQPHLHDPRNFIQTMNTVWPLLNEMAFEGDLAGSKPTEGNKKTTNSAEDRASVPVSPADGTATEAREEPQASNRPLCKEPRGAASFVYSKSPVLYDLAIKLPPTSGTPRVKRKPVNNILREECRKVWPDFHQSVIEKPNGVKKEDKD